MQVTNSETRVFTSSYPARKFNCDAFRAAARRALVGWNDLEVGTPNLKQALAGLETRIGQRFDAELKHSLTDRETRPSEKMEAIETKLLSAFHGWAVTYEVRARGTSTAVCDLDERLGRIEERVAKLERGRNGQTGKRSANSSIHERACRPYLPTR